MIRSHKELIVWKKAIKLVKEIYILASKFPSSEFYGIISQMRRAAVSIPSNIAEGCGRKSRKEYAHACSIAYGSALELETQIIIAKELMFAETNDFETVDQLLGEILRMLNSMTAKMNS
jgi:four helix bundle protein